MREIKFRIWDGENYVSLSEALYIQLVGVQYNRKDGFELESYFDGVVIEQYTGLKDKNGVEIYEGDIVKDKYNKIQAIVFDDDIGSCGCCYGPSFEGVGLVADLIGLREAEVIGNIHENPELLKE